MPFNIPSIPYPPPREGYWHPITSTLNWCEEDYYLTPYSAEIVNTLTNLLFVYLAIKGIRNCIRNGHDTIFLVSFIGYLLVGTGSFLFHSTLKYPMQLVDELSMIYTTCLMCYASFSYGRSPQFAKVLAVALVGLAAFITLYYHYLQDPSFHQNAYALLTTIVLAHSMYVMETSIRPSMRRNESKLQQQRREKPDGSVQKTVQDREDRRDEKIVNEMWFLIATGMTVFLTGFGFWTFDNEYCSHLRGWRRQVGLPWGILLEGHGWWHLLTGTGAYFYIVWGIWLRHCLNGRQEEYKLVWPSLFSLPEIVKREAPQANGSAPKRKVQNGQAKKTR